MPVLMFIKSYATNTASLMCVLYNYPFVRSSHRFSITSPLFLPNNGWLWSNLDPISCLSTTGQAPYLVWNHILGLQYFYFPTETATNSSFFVTQPEGFITTSSLSNNLQQWMIINHASLLLLDKELNRLKSHWFKFIQ